MSKRKRICRTSDRRSGCQNRRELHLDWRDAGTSTFALRLDS